jgi:RNA polymerase sigma-70 factor, ECF subfamily
MSAEDSESSLLSCYQGLKSHLRRKVGKITQNRSITEEILQETLTRGFEELSKNTIRYPRAWLERVAHNLAVTYSRQAKPKSLKTEVETQNYGSWGDEELPPSLQLTSELGLEEMVAELPEQYSKVLSLQYWEGLGMNEIGERLNISPTFAKQLAYRGRCQIRRQLEKRVGSDFCPYSE